MTGKAMDEIIKNHFNTGLNKCHIHNKKLSFIIYSTWQFWNYEKESNNTTMNLMEEKSKED